MSSFIDIHCHPTLKHYLFGTAITSTASPADDVEVTDFLALKNLSVSLPRMEKGNVGLIWASHYLPERALIDKANINSIIRNLLLSFLENSLKKFENNSTPEAPYQQTTKAIVEFTKHVTGAGAAIPKNLSEMKSSLAANKKVFLHALEGAHHLGRNRIKGGKPDVDGYLDALNTFGDLGVCSMTLGHFFPNDCVAPINGLPPHVVELLHYPTTFPDTGLSDVGTHVVNWMLEHGMVIDLTHSSPRARKAVYEINKSRVKPRPLTFTHAGAEKVFKAFAAPEHQSDSHMNPTNDELLEIKNCNGVIGIILNMYWLCGNEEPNQFLGLIPDPGLSFVVTTVKHIHDVTGSYENIAIGSDFDGFADPIDDAPDASDMPKVAQALNDAGIPAGDVDKIMSQNALRVLEEGWH